MRSATAWTSGNVPPRSNRWLSPVIVSLGVAVGPLDTAVNIAFPAITAAFAIPVTTFVIKAIIEAAWNNSRAPRINRTILARQEDLPKAVTEAAWKAQTRLHQRYQHLTGVGRKKAQVAAAALGRELAGFVWAIGRMVKPRALADGR